MNISIEHLLYISNLYSGKDDHLFTSDLCMCRQCNTWGSTTSICFKLHYYIHILHQYKM